MPPLPTLTRKKRLLTVNETKMKCIEHDLTDDIATKILFTMLDNYVNDGTSYVNKELVLQGHYDRPRKYLINLYNDVSKRDTVLIRSIEK